jgi:serine O-acetyltransferase
MIRLFLADVSRLHHYFGGAGLLSWVKLVFMRSVWAVFFVRMRGMRIPVLGLLLRPFAVIFLVNFFKIELAGQCRIGPGLMLLHPNDLIIGACEIGDNVTLMNSITLGAQYPDPAFSSDKRPRVGCNVTIGVGARVLGGIAMGDYSIVGANSVVVKSVPVGAVVGGIPARILKLTKN